MGAQGRIVFVSGMLATAFIGIVTIFWNQEMQYVLPTPKPENHTALPLGAAVDLPVDLRGEDIAHLHFYNPECPCSRFNLNHFKTLASTYANAVSFFAIVPPPEEPQSGYEQKLASKLGPNVEVRIDTNGEIAKAVGVYSTPQAVLVTADGTLAYRGNYNRSRYCTSLKTDFVGIALKALLKKEPIPQFSALAYIAYGCQIDQPNPSTLSPNLYGSNSPQQRD